MALTEQPISDTDIARIYRDVYGATRFSPLDKEFVLRVIAALPKPEPVAHIDQAMRIKWLVSHEVAAKLIGHKIYTEAHAAQPASECQCSMTTKLVGDGCAHCNPEYAANNEAKPASAPTGWDAEFLAKRLGRVAKLSGVLIPERFTHEQVAETAGTILGQIAAAMEAKPASAPSEQKPVAYFLETAPYTWKQCWPSETGAKPLYLAPQLDYKAQRDAERYRWLRDHNKSWSWNPSQYNKEIISGFAEFNTGYLGFEFEVAIDAAIASVKGGE